MNLDELNTLFASAWSSDEKALMFEGLVRGSNGTVAPESAPGPLKEANALALKWRAEAEEFLRKAEEGGKKSAAARASRFGTSQPPSGNSRTPFGDSSNQATSDKRQANKEQQEENPNAEISARDSEAAPAPSSPEKSHTKSKAQAGMERELSLKERLVDVWNASCTQAKAKTGRCLPSCRVFPAGALPSLKTYMRIYSDDEILHLVADGAFKVQRSDWYHARKYSLTNLMRNLEANASLPAPAKVAPTMTETPTDLSSFLTSPDRAKNEEEVPNTGRGTILATNPDDIWDLP